MNYLNNLNIIIIIMILVFGILFVGILQSITPFLDKIPLSVLTAFELIKLKLLICFLPFIALIIYIIIKRKDNTQIYNKKIILITFVGMLIICTHYYISLNLLKKYSPGIVIPSVLSCIVVFTLIIDFLIFKRKINKIDILCTIMIAISIYILSSRIEEGDDIKRFDTIIEYLKN